MCVVPEREVASEEEESWREGELMSYVMKVCDEGVVKGVVWCVVRRLVWCGVMCNVVK